MELKKAIAALEEVMTLVVNGCHEVYFCNVIITYLNSRPLTTICCLFLRLRAIFPREPGLTGFFWKLKDNGSGGDNWSYESCEAPFKSSPLQLTGWMPFLSPNQQCQSTEGSNDSVI